MSARDEQIWRDYLTDEISDHYAEKYGAESGERVRKALDADVDPARLTEEQVDALAEAGNRAVANYHHDDLCACKGWPSGCKWYGPHSWDTGAWETGMAAVIGLWESMRSSETAEAAPLSPAREAELLEGEAGPCDCGEGAVHYTAAECPFEQRRRAGESSPADLTVYRAQHDAIVMGLYTTRQAAYEHCEAHAMRDDPASPMFWRVDEDGVAELYRTLCTRSPGADAPTGFVVTPLTVQDSYDEEDDE